MYAEGCVKGPTDNAVIGPAPSTAISSTHVPNVNVISGLETVAYATLAESIDLHGTTPVFTFDKGQSGRKVIGIASPMARRR